jgi:hypothetical protein
MADVFISYKQEEREAVQIIASSLNDLKLSVWFDTKLRAGGSFDEEIAAALNDAKCVLVCWTPAAIQSEWVRGEATQGKESNRLAAAMLQPTTLIPPFNLVNAVNLTAWAGQPDDPAWLKLLERIGELTGRPGLSTYYEVMRAGASKEELHAWATENGADPLAAAVWDRIKLIEGEGAAERIAREQAEARATGERRRAQAERSRRLIRERGLRDPRTERLRFLGLVGAVAGIALISLGAIFYFVDAQGRERQLNDARDVAAVRVFIANNSWHPVAGLARAKLISLDADAWRVARESGTVASLQGYITEAQKQPNGAYIAQARVALTSAQQTLHVQTILSRLLIYRGPLNGAKDEATTEAIYRFRYRWNLPITSAIDAPLLDRLNAALNIWIHPRIEDIHVVDPRAAGPDDFIRLASQYGVDVPTIMAVGEVESGPLGGFASDGRPILLFERHLFSRKTNHQYDAAHPDVSNPMPGGYPRTQSERWNQLAQAFALDQEAALQSASYGRVQLLGQNYRNFDFETAGEYVRFMAQSDSNQYEALMRFARANNLIDDLQRRDWASFARGYNGPGYYANFYDQKLAAAYARIVQRVAQENETIAPDIPGYAPPTYTPPPAAAADAAEDTGVEITKTREPDSGPAITALTTVLATALAALALLLKRRRRA